LILWRISNYSDLSGVGGTKYSGRWHHAGNSVVYLADHPALALLETLVHLEIPSIEDMPGTFRLLEVDVPSDSVHDQVITNTEWKSDQEWTMNTGSAWLESHATLLLRVPSAIVPGSNYLLNPSHPRSSECKVVNVVDHPFDPRLF